MTVEGLMTRDVVTVSPDASLEDVAALLSERRISGMPVCDAGGRVIGVVSEADVVRTERGIEPGTVRRFFRRRGDEPGEIPARTAAEAMTTPALTIQLAEHAATAARLMLDHGFSRLPVVSDGALVGIVTRADLLRAFHRHDDEIADEIRDDVLGALWIAPSTLGLTVEDGVASVWGQVETDLDAESIIRCIRRVPGVVEVRAELHARTGERPGASV